MKLSLLTNYKVRNLSVLLVLLSYAGCSPMLKTPASSQGAQRSTGQGSQASTAMDCPLEFKKVAFCAQLAPLQKPLAVGKLFSFKLAFWQRDSGIFLGPYVDPGLTPSAWLWMTMPSGSHGSGPITVTSASDGSGAVVPGVYDVNRVVFTMPSRSDEEWWEIHIELKQSDGTVVDEAVQTIVGI